MNYAKILMFTISFALMACNKSNFAGADKANNNRSAKKGAGIEIDNELAPGGTNPTPICDGEISIALLMDTSLSMTFPPVGGNTSPISDLLGGGSNTQSMVNIEKARRIASEIVTSLSAQDEIGIATFAKQASEIVPLDSLSTNRQTALHTAQNLQAVRGLENAGTNITGALKIGQNMLSGVKRNKVVIIISDGEQQRVEEELPEIYSDNLKSDGVTVFAIGLNLKPVGIDSLSKTSSGTRYFLNTDDSDTNIDEAISFIKYGLCKK